MATALVTGASRGIGAAVARRLAGDGHDVAVAYRGQSAAAERVVSDIQGLGRWAAAFAADLEHAESINGLVADVRAQMGPISILIANAGINDPMQQDPELISVPEWDRAMAINLRAPFLLARATLGAMRAAGYGRIVLMSSVAAYTGGIIGPHYAASKAALHGLAHSLSALASVDGVTVNVVAPALIVTDMLPAGSEARSELAARVPAGRLGEPAEVADLVAAVVRNGYMTNQSILIDGGMHPS
jgi:3-oxoacyl-[acyl-carrier protein] reductase